MASSDGTLLPPAVSGESDNGEDPLPDLTHPEDNFLPPHVEDDGGERRGLHLPPVGSVDELGGVENSDEDDGNSDYDLEGNVGAFNLAAAYNITAGGLLISLSFIAPTCGASGTCHWAQGFVLP